MIVTAKAPNISSLTKGIIPRIVVMDARKTGRKREDDASRSARKRSFPDRICISTSSTSTTPFLIIIPTSPKAPTIATNPNSFPASSIPNTTPIIASGKQRMIINGFLKSLNSAISIANTSTIPNGTFLNKYCLDCVLARYSPCHSVVYPGGIFNCAILGNKLFRTSFAV